METGRESGGVLARDISCTVGSLSTSTATGEGDRAVGVETGFCLLGFVAVSGFGVAGREEDASEEAFVVEVLRSLVVAADNVLVLPVIEPDRC